YFYEVEAQNASGTSAPSAEASATTTPPAPSAPASLTATGGVGKVDLNWAAVTGAVNYRVLRGTAAGAETANPIATVSVTTYTDTTVAGGTTYFYEVEAQNAGGVSPPSPEKSALTAPDAPTGLTATGKTQSVDLTWTASQGAAGYLLYRGATAGGESATAIATPTGPSHTDSGR